MDKICLLHTLLHTLHIYVSKEVISDTSNFSGGTNGYFVDSGGTWVLGGFPNFGIQEGPLTNRPPPFFRGGG